MPISGYPPPPSGVSNTTNTRDWGPGWPACQGTRQRWIYLSNGVGLQARSEVAEMLNLLLNESLRRGYQIRDADSAGYVCRAITGTLIPSNHSWGLAVDLNWKSNPMGTHTTNIPVWMVQLMWAYRWYWGGWYNSPDPMHFEFVGTPAQAVSYTTLARKAYPMTHPEVDLVASQENALAEVWAFVVANRDGVKAPKTKTHPGGFTQLQFQLDRIEDKITDVDSKLTILNTKLDQLLARPAGGEVVLKPSAVTAEGTLRFTPVPTGP